MRARLFFGAFLLCFIATTYLAKTTWLSVRSTFSSNELVSLAESADDDASDSPIDAGAAIPVVYHDAAGAEPSVVEPEADDAQPSEPSEPVAPPDLGVRLAATPSRNVTQGTNMTLVATPTGGAGEEAEGYLYAFSLWDAEGKKSPLRGFETQRSFVWAATVEPGAYTLSVLLSTGLNDDRSPREPVAEAFLVVRVAAAREQNPAPASLKEAQKEARLDVAYITGGKTSADDAHRLDIYPARAAGKGKAASAAAPVIIDIHGGGWNEGDKSMQNMPLIAWLNQQGVCVVEVNYRLQTEGGGPLWREQLEDVRAAIRWVYDNAGELGVDKNRISLMGSSAGAHLAMMAAYMAEGGDDAATGAVKIRSVINVCGPADLALEYDEVPESTGAEMRPAVKNLLGLDSSPHDSGAAMRAYMVASPVSHIAAGAPPTLSFYGLADIVVPAANGVELHEVLQSAGVPSETYYIPKANHNFSFVWDEEPAVFFVNRLESWIKNYVF